MALPVEIRDSRPADTAAIEALYPDAFPDEDLLPVVGKLLQATSGVLSLVALAGGALAGHVVFTTCSIDPGNGQVSNNAALLGPLAVASAKQQQGIGSALVRTGFQRLETAGLNHVYVLGDPAYYGRFGFRPDHDVAPPYPMPDEWRDAWQSVHLGGSTAPGRGKLAVPAMWDDPALWGP